MGASITPAQTRHLGRAPITSGARGADTKEWSS